MATIHRLSLIGAVIVCLVGAQANVTLSASEGSPDVLKPLLMGLGAFAVVGLLMLGGWALTSATPEVPERQAPAAAGHAEPGPGAARGRAGGRPQQTGAGAQPATRRQEDAVRDEAAAPATLTLPANSAFQEPAFTASSACWPTRGF